MFLFVFVADFCSACYNVLSYCVVLAGRFQSSVTVSLRLLNNYTHLGVRWRLEMHVSVNFFMVKISQKIVYNFVKCIRRPLYRTRSIHCTIYYPVNWRCSFV